MQRQSTPNDPGGRLVTRISLDGGVLRTDRPHPSSVQTLFASGGFSFVHTTAPPGDFGGTNITSFFSLSLTVGGLGHMDWDAGDGTMQGGSVADGEQFLWLAERPTYGCMATPLECLTLFLDPLFLLGASRETLDPDRVEVLPQSRLRDPLVAGVGHALHRQHARHGVIDKLYGETLGASLAVHLLRHCTTLRPAVADLSARGLAPRDLRRAVAYVMDNLDGDLSLTNIAASVHLSPYHFARLFKMATGQAPHRYVVSARVEKAKALLRGGKLSVGEVAHAVGFYDHAHFTRHFKRSVGVTPSVYRER